MLKIPPECPGGYEYETTASTQKSVEAVVSCLLYGFYHWQGSLLTLAPAGVDLRFATRTA